MKGIGISIILCGLALLISGLSMSIYGPYAFGHSILSAEKVAFRAIFVILSCSICLAGVMFYVGGEIKRSINDQFAKPVEQTKKPLTEYQLFGENNSSRLDEDAIFNLAMNYRHEFPSEKTTEIIRIKALEIAEIINRLPASLIPNFERMLRERVEILRKP